MFKTIKTADRKFNEPDIIININNIVSIDGNILNMTNGEKHDLMRESLRAVILAITPKNTEVKNKEANSDLLELFNKLHKLTGGKGTAVFSLQREKKLSELLGKHRMTKELLIQSATNIGEDAFLQGDNESKKRYGDIDYLLRPDKAAKYSEDQGKKKKSGMF